VVLELVVLEKTNSRENENRKTRKTTFVKGDRQRNTALKEDSMMTINDSFWVIK
tara:strand:+ start:177 stop:338 length:162 start_codon:yes stop_codon:yes gene_type:complete